MRRKPQGLLGAVVVVVVGALVALVYFMRPGPAAEPAGRAPVETPTTATRPPEPVPERRRDDPTNATGRTPSGTAPASAPPGSIADLLQRARRDDRAAADEAFEKLKDCRRAPRNPTEIAERVAKEAPDVRDGYRQVLEDAYRRCGSFSDEEVKSEMDATRLAARLGNNDARIRYFERGMPAANPSDPASEGRRQEFIREANRLLDAAVADGSIEAMVARGRAYERGYLSDVSAEKAYAYMYAATLTEAAQNRKLLPPTTLERFEGFLNSTTIEEGKRDGESIFKECCSPEH
jgi:hypothetical protein